MRDRCPERSAVSMKGSRRPSRHRLAQAAGLKLHAVLPMVYREVATLTSPWGAEWESRWRPPAPMTPWEICRHRSRNIRKDVPEGGGATQSPGVGGSGRRGARGRAPNGTPDSLFTLRQMASQSLGRVRLS